MSLNYVIAIPSFNRPTILPEKTLRTLKKYYINPECIFIFVANQHEKILYENNLTREDYNEIVVGQLGITNQRIFISNYFPENTYIISMDDDIEDILLLQGKPKSGQEKLIELPDLNLFITNAYNTLRNHNLYIWGIYPVKNPFFMYEKTTLDRRFIIGVLFGFINRHLPELNPLVNSETKEDYEQTILYYKKDGGVVRFNNVTIKTKFNADGGLGKGKIRIDKSILAANYLASTYPNIITVFYRKNGTAEVKLAK